MAHFAASGPVSADAGDEQANHGLILLIVAVATIGGFMFGYDSGVINGTVDGLQKAFGSDSVGTGFNVASILLGCAVGAFAAGRLADRWGRRAVMLVSALLFMVTAWGAGAATSSGTFVFARFIGGLAVGAASVLAPAYISEVTPAAIRGRLASIQQIMIISGLTGAFLGNYVIAHAAGGSTEPFWWGFAAWRWMFWVQVIPAGLFLLTLLLIPESPRYLVAKGRLAEAEQVLTRLFGERAARRKVGEISASLAGDHQPRLSDLIERTSSGSRIRPIVWAGLVLAIFQQLVGINVVFYYGAVLWQAVGFTEGDALKINVLSGTLSILACIAAMVMIDKVGRKPLLLLGSAGMALTLGAMAAAFSTGTLEGGSLHLSDNAGLIALISANAYAVLFNLSWGPVMWVMLGEMFPNQIRGSGLAVSGFAQWIANFAITMSFPVLLVSVGLTGAYGFYAASALVSFFFVRALVKETKGRELEDMQG
ncbi:sugar porter family MFS transporter [Niveispirillum sp. SYP-B3756]|uniref:sugar porter family MFS transporter n=1 Tax=Niveispirillum sp. SYP-B3756 TaxID=2662178 RepID=UPI0012921B23|nr:sugar porter family MFS transporter [Niveispirillum sp. SYP-B3756]MQP65035.1 sugar porter family MFS transporter [Niveispirillum sp. SYP-B3756]